MKLKLGVNDGRLAAVFVLMGCMNFVAADELKRQFDKDGLHIVVSPVEFGFDEARAYQIVVNDPLKVVARLEVSRDGLVSDVWITDMDRDGAFEVVVATGQLAGTDRGGIDIHEWHEFRFESTRSPDFPATSNYRGNDQFSVENGVIRRSYPIFSEIEGNGVPTGEIAQYRYNFTANRWDAVTP